MKKSYDSKFKSRLALEALRGDQTIAEIAGRYQIHPNLVQQWKKKLLSNASEVFLTKGEQKPERNVANTMDAFYCVETLTDGGR